MCGALICVAVDQCIGVSGATIELAVFDTLSHGAILRLPHQCEMSRNSFSVAPKNSSKRSAAVSM